MAMTHDRPDLWTGLIDGNAFDVGEFRFTNYETTFIQNCYQDMSVSQCIPGSVSVAIDGKVKSHRQYNRKYNQKKTQKAL